MSIADTIIQRLVGEINALPRGGYGEVLLDAQPFEDLPDPGIFLEPEPDVLEAPEHPHPTRECGEHPTLLGVYVPMQSPGRIILIEGNLRRFYWSLIARLWHRHPYLFPRDLEGAAQLVVQKTYQHERFHFHCDVLCHLLGGRYDRLQEEALAVAWSRAWIQQMQWSSKAKRMNPALFIDLMEGAFAYRSPGYRDWVLFADRARFAPALLDYVAASASVVPLRTNGVSNLADVVTAMIGGFEGGVAEEIG